MSKASDRDSLVRLLEPVVAAEGLDLEDVVITPAGKRRLLRVVVDRDGGIGLDTVAAVSTAVSGRAGRARPDGQLAVRPGGQLARASTAR